MIAVLLTILLCIFTLLSKSARSKRGTPTVVSLPSSRGLSVLAAMDVGGFFHEIMYLVYFRSVTVIRSIGVSLNMKLA